MKTPELSTLDNTESETTDTFKCKAEEVLHDLNNICMALHCRMEELNPDKLKPCDADTINEIRTLTDRARKLINEILHPEKSVSKKEEKNIADLVKETVKMLSLDKKVSINFTHQGSLIAELDTDKMASAIQNVLSNSLQAISDDGEITISIKRENGLQDTEEPFIFLEITDNGCGMTEETRKKIFNPYFTTKGLKENKGLGLFSVKKTINMHGGTIDVKSEPGKGTTFMICLPAKNIAKTHEDQEIMERKNIFLIDDNPLIAKVNQRFAEKLGLEFESANNAKEGLEKLKEAPLGTLVLLDQNLKDGTKGTQLVEEIKRIRPDLVIILCTGQNCENFERLVDHGLVNGLLEKPYTIKDIEKLIETF